jgi:hypothetical protein
MNASDVWEFQIKKFLESRNITDLSNILLVPRIDGIEIYDNDIYIGVVR